MAPTAPKRLAVYRSTSIRFRARCKRPGMTGRHTRRGAGPQTGAADRPSAYDRPLERHRPPHCAERPAPQSDGGRNSSIADFYKWFKNVLLSRYYVINSV